MFPTLHGIVYLFLGVTFILRVFCNQALAFATQLFSTDTYLTASLLFESLDLPVSDLLSIFSNEIISEVLQLIQAECSA